MNLRRAVAVVGLTTALVSGTALAATAITGGELDGNRHPNVGMIGYYDSTGRLRCTATLVTPTVLVTAAHCAAGALGKTAVKFDSLIDESPAPPAALPLANDPAAGYTAAELTAAGWLSGTAYAHPDYSNFTDKQNWNDVGVIVLDQPVTGIEPARIAPLGYLDQFTPPVLNKTVFTTVGYGVEVVTPAVAPKRPELSSYPIVRRFAESPGQKLTPQILQVNGNANDQTGTGGTCFGDSGGPAFIEGYEVTVTSYNNDALCRHIDGLQRLDIPVVQDWLATFGVNAG
jgi:hypothetical protein